MRLALAFGLLLLLPLSPAIASFFSVFWFFPPRTTYDAPSRSAVRSPAYIWFSLSLRSSGTSWIYYGSYN